MKPSSSVQEAPVYLGGEHLGQEHLEQAGLGPHPARPGHEDAWVPLEGPCRVQTLWIPQAFSLSRNACEVGWG